MLDCCSVLVQRSAELCAALVALLAVLGSEATQEDFHKADRVPVLADVLQAHTGAQRKNTGVLRIPPQNDRCTV